MVVVMKKTLKVKVSQKSVNSHSANKSNNGITKSDLFQAIISFSICLVTIICSAVIAYKSDNIYEKQLKLEEMTSKPIINIEVLYNDDKSKIDEITVTNEGAVTGNITVDVFPFYSLCIYDVVSENGKDLSKTLYVPIKYNSYKIDYYNTKKGLICNIAFSDFCEKHYGDIKEISKNDTNSISENFKISEVSIEYLISINYLDVSGNKCNELYHCIPNYIFAEFTDANISNMVERKLEFIEDDDILKEIYNKMSPPNLIITTDELSYYKSYDTTSEMKFKIFTEAVVKAYNNHQYID